MVADPRGLALLFPGQGSQGMGMGKALAERYPGARRLRGGRSRARLRALDHSVSRAEGSGAHREHAARPARDQRRRLARARAKGHRAVGGAGHSAGEYAAHVAAGTFSYEDGLRLIRARGEAMARAGTERPGAMAAVLGLGMEQIADVSAPSGAARSGRGEPQLAGPGGPLGDARGPLARGMEEAKRLGAKRVVPLG